MKIERRSFLALAGGALAAPRLGSAAPADATGPRSLKLGLASYSLRKFPTDKMLEMCQEAGIQYISIKDMHMPRTDTPEATRATRAKIEAAGLTILGGGVIYMKKDAAQIKKEFEYAKNGGFPMIVAGPDLDALDLVEAAIKEFDMKVAIHNHGPEDKMFPAPMDVYKALKGRDKRFGLCMDIGHTVRAGADPVKTVAEVKDRLFDLHVKDLRSKTDKDSQTEVGKGVLDFPGLFRALRAISFQGHVALEYEIKADNPLPGIKESFAYMRGVLAALESA